MITLKIKEKGHLLEIPGLAPFRTPADIDVSRIDIRKVIGHLQVNGITDYKVIAISESGEQEIYNQDDFLSKKQKKKKKKEDPYRKEIDTRFNKLEKILLALLSKEKGNDDSKEEQINKKLMRLEQLSERILNKQPETIIYKEKKKKVDINEGERFIPDVDIGNFKITSKSIKSIKQEQKDDIDNAADSLSELLGGKK